MLSLNYYFSCSKYEKLKNKTENKKEGLQKTVMVLKCLRNTFINTTKYLNENKGLNKSISNGNICNFSHGKLKHLLEYKNGDEILTT